MASVHPSPPSFSVFHLVWNFMKAKAVLFSTHCNSVKSKTIRQGPKAVLWLPKAMYQITPQCRHLEKQQLLYCPSQGLWVRNERRANSDTWSQWFFLSVFHAVAEDVKAMDFLGIVFSCTVLGASLWVSLSCPVGLPYTKAVSEQEDSYMTTEDLKTDKSNSKTEAMMHFWPKLGSHTASLPMHSPRDRWVLCLPTCQKRGLCFLQGAWEGSRRHWVWDIMLQLSPSTASIQLFYRLSL